jgi:hypothetical protein
LTSSWDWFTSEYGQEGIRLIFARGSSTRRVVESYGLAISDGRVITADDAYESPGFPWVRVGTTGDWAFAIDNSALDTSGIERTALSLSAGTDVARFETGTELNYFYYYVDGTEVTSFEPLLAHERYGSDPDRFLSQMRLVGLEVDVPADDELVAAPERDPAIALLDLLTLALGIRLPGDVALGPLLTLQPG